MSKTNLKIIKIGGKILEDEILRDTFLKSFAKIKGAKILVHGGGRRASEIGSKLGISPRVVNGRRITDKATLEIVTMVYAGLVNKQIVSCLQKYNCNAIGLSGADLNVIKSIKRPVKELDYGYVGDIDNVQSNPIMSILNIGGIPVFNAITHDQKGQLLNTNADTIASSLACALATHFEVCLYYCFEQPGVLTDPSNSKSLLTKIKYSIFETYKKEGIISGGMIPKLDNAFLALKNKTKRVYIGHADQIETIHEFKGTEVCLK